jgi:putative phosphoribosyl transferase
LLFDLLTSEEEIFDERTAALRFDIDLLAKRLVDATRWTKRNPQTKPLRIGYFGASTGAAAALVAAAIFGAAIGAVVSRGGRPDLAGTALRQVHTPTLLIVGGHDHPVLELNRKAQAQMHHAKTELVIIPRATHLFPEPGALEEVARMAASWFRRYLTPTDLSLQPTQHEVQCELE